MSLNSEPGSGERISVAKFEYQLTVRVITSKNDARPKTTPKFLAFMRFLSLCSSTLWTHVSIAFISCEKSLTGVNAILAGAKCDNAR